VSALAERHAAATKSDSIKRDAAVKGSLAVMHSTTPSPLSDHSVPSSLFCINSIRV